MPVIHVDTDVPLDHLAELVRSAADDLVDDVATRAADLEHQRRHNRADTRTRSVKLVQDLADGTALRRLADALDEAADRSKDTEDGATTTLPGQPVPTYVDQSSTQADGQDDGGSAA